MEPKRHLWQEERIGCLRKKNYLPNLSACKLEMQSKRESPVHPVSLYFQLFRQQCFDFLSAGGSLAPIDSLKLADADMTGSKVIQGAMKAFEKAVSKMEKLMEN